MPVHRREIKEIVFDFYAPSGCFQVSDKAQELLAAVFARETDYQTIKVEVWDSTGMIRYQIYGVRQDGLPYHLKGNAETLTMHTVQCSGCAMITLKTKIEMS